jgi:hypothetical protein
MMVIFRDIYRYNKCKRELQPLIIPNNYISTKTELNTNMSIIPISCETFDLEMLLTDLDVKYTIIDKEPHKNINNVYKQQLIVKINTE